MPFTQDEFEQDPSLIDSMRIVNQALIHGTYLTIEELDLAEAFDPNSDDFLLDFIID